MAEALKTKFKDYPQVRNIIKHKHLPKAVHAASKEHAVIRAKHRRKERNIRLFNNKNLPFISEKEKHTVAIYK